MDLPHDWQIGDHTSCHVPNIADMLDAGGSHAFNVSYQPLSITSANEAMLASMTRPMMSHRPFSIVTLCTCLSKAWSAWTLVFYATDINISFRLLMGLCCGSYKCCGILSCPAFSHQPCPATPLINWPDARPPVMTGVCTAAGHCRPPCCQIPRLRQAHKLDSKRGRRDNLRQHHL